MTTAQMLAAIAQAEALVIAGDMAEMAALAEMLQEYAPYLDGSGGLL